MNWGLLGQVVVVVWAVGFVMSMLLLACADWKEGRYQRDHTVALEIDKAWNRTYGRGESVDLPRDPMKYGGRDLTPEQARAVRISDSRWQDEARTSEGAEDDWDRGDAA